MSNIILKVKRPVPTVNQLIQYAEKHGWVHVQTMRRKADLKKLWDDYQQKDKDGIPYTIYIPSSDEWSDNAFRFQESIETIAEYEGRDSLEVYNDIVGVKEGQP